MVILILALGIGGNTAIFSMINGIVLRALPYSRSEQLYVIQEVAPRGSGNSLLPARAGNFLIWRKQCQAFSGMALIGSSAGSLFGQSRHTWLHGAEVTADFFSVLSVVPRLGRPFLARDGVTGANVEIILTHQLWEQQFHSDPQILGKIINLSGTGMTIVGVLPPYFQFPSVLGHAPEYLVSFPWTESKLRPGIGFHNYFAIARLKPGIDPDKAEAELATIEARIAEGNSASHFDLYAKITPLKTIVVGSTPKILWMLATAAGVVLLIICVNVANLMLVKNSARVREVAVRAALGATRWRLERQFLTEAVLLVFVGSALGLVFAEGGLWFLVRNAPVGIPRVTEIRIDARVLGFTLAIAAATTVVFALLPAARLARIEPADALKSAGSGSSTGKRAAHLRGILAIGEIALCAALLPGSLLLLESLRHAVVANQWMEEEHVLATDLLDSRSQLRPAEDTSRTLEERIRTLTAIQKKIELLPGVESAAFASVLPLGGSEWGDDINFRELPRLPAELPTGEFRFVSAGYFQVIGLPLVKGRFFSEADSGKPVALISESVARKVLAGRDPLGMHLACADFAPKGHEWCLVVGVVADVNDEYDKPPALVAYAPLWEYAEPAETLLVRTKMDSEVVASPIRQTVSNVDPEIAIPRQRTLKAIVEDAEAPRRYETFLGALLAVFAVLLAMLGLYAVVSCSVRQRSREIGIHIALGAQRSRVMTRIITEGLVLAIIGIAIGIAGGSSLNKLISSLLYGVRPNDPDTVLVVSLLLSTVSLLACYIPAHRATRVNPAEILRYQ